MENSKDKPDLCKFICRVSIISTNIVDVIGVIIFIIIHLWVIHTGNIHAAVCIIQTLEIPDTLLVL